MENLKIFVLSILAIFSREARIYNWNYLNNFLLILEEFHTSMQYIDYMPHSLSSYNS